MSLLKRIESARPGGGERRRPRRRTRDSEPAGTDRRRHRRADHAGDAAADVPGPGPGVVPRRQVPDPEPGHPGPGPEARPVQPGRGPAPDRGDLRQGHRRGRPRPDPRRARPDAGADHRRDHRSRSARAAPARRVDHRGDGQRPAPGLHRTLGQAGADQRRLPERRPRHAHHRSDHRPDRSTRRRVVADGRRPTDRRLPRQRHHPAAVPRRTGHHHPQVLGLAVHDGRPHPVRDRDRRHVRLPPRLRRGSPEHLRVRRHRLGQDDDPQRPLVVHPERRADRDDRGRRRAAAPPGARRHARVAPAEHRGQGRHPDPRARAQRPAHAARPHHRRGVSFR